MIVYKVLKHEHFIKAAITFIENGINKVFCLNEGDLFFIKPNFVQHIVDNNWKTSNLLVKIVYKKMTSLDDYEWCEINNINIANPFIDIYIKGFLNNDIKTNNFKQLKEFGCLEDISKSWNRDQKLKEILDKW
jgi:hypothetical protein